MKKIKNPKKYIERLKAERDRFRKLFFEWQEKCYKEAGVRVVSWEGYDIEQNASRNFFTNVLPGQKIAIIGTAILVENSIDPACNNKHGKLIVRVKETRVLPD